MEAINKIPAIFEEFEKLKTEFIHFIDRGEVNNQETIKHYRTKWINLRSRTSKIKGELTKFKISRDDKACTAKKARLFRALVDSGLPVTKAREQAPAEEEYKEFLEERVLYMEAYSNILSIREDMQNFINDCAGRIN